MSIRRRTLWLDMCLVGVCLLSYPLLTFAETVNVGLEPMPPLITEDGTGYTVELLRAIE